MPTAVTRQKRNGLSRQLGKQHLIRRLAESGLRHDPTGIFQSLNMVNTTAADNAQHSNYSLKFAKRFVCLTTSPSLRSPL